MRLKFKLSLKREGEFKGIKKIYAGDFSECACKKHTEMTKAAERHAVASGATMTRPLGQSGQCDADRKIC